ncbi:hypothetical protein B0J14DRAFT_581863 [Halenospora varia]|nr:hypothetical protein B0J14DRAFT_581863 [Halenospora varia]
MFPESERLALTMHSPYPRHRSADPQTHGKTPFPPQQDSEEHVSGSGLLSLNIFYLLKSSSGFRLSMSNCRGIEVPVIYPCVPSRASSETASIFTSQEIHEVGQEIIFENDKATVENMDADQECSVDLQLSLTRTLSRAPPSPLEHFRFLDLPLELRLKIYGYLLPARTHTIVTQIPYNGFFYNTATIPTHSAQSFYPFGRNPPKNLTTYKVLNSNFRSSFPLQSIYTDIFRVCKQIHAEAESTLYASNDSVFDFGIYGDALIAFMGDRSERARALIRNIRIAKEIPGLDYGNGGLGEKRDDEKWIKLCTYIKNEMPSLRNLDLTVWGGSGNLASLPISRNPASPSQNQEDQWHEWEYTKGLLEMEALRAMKVTWWGFCSEKGQEGQTIGFDSWLAGRMVGDKLVRDRMIKDGVVVEGVVVLRGNSA